MYYAEGIAQKEIVIVLIVNQQVMISETVLVYHLDKFWLTLCHFLRNDKVNVSYERIGNLFGKSKQSVYDQLKNYQRGPAPDGHPSCLTSEELSIIEYKITEIITNNEFPVYPTFDDIDDCIIENFNKCIRRDTLRHIIHNILGNKFKTCVGKPIELKRMESSIENIEENLNQLKRLIDNTPANFIFNLDEVGLNYFADAEEKRVIVPIEYEACVAPYAVPRKGKRSSCLVAISPYGIFGKPQHVVSRVTVDSNMFQYVPYDAFQIVHTKSGFVNTESFLHYMQNNFSPKFKKS